MRHSSIGRRIVIAFAVTITCLFGFETANACRLFWRHHCSPCPPVVYCQPGCPPVHCGEVIVESNEYCGHPVEHSEYEYEHGESSGDMSPTPSDTSDTRDLSDPPSMPAGDDEPADTADDAAADDAASDDAIPDVDTESDVAPPDPPFEIPTEPDADAIPQPDEPGVDSTPDELPSIDEPVEPDDNLDDLFGDPLPETDDALPNVEPATDQPADAIEAPADEEDVPLDDLFGEGTDSEPADSDLDDLFNAPEDIEDTPPVDDLDDLFPADEVPGDQTEGSDDNLDDLFSQSSPDTVSDVVHKEISIETRPDDRTVRYRLWTDDTGSFQTVGRLTKITRENVRLLKSNGRYTTVPMHRLSGKDLAYVQRLAKKLRPDVTLFAQR